MAKTFCRSGKCFWQYK